MRKIAIVVGHNRVSQGAVRPDTGESEFEYNGKMAEYMQRIASNYGLQVRIFTRTPGGGYTSEIERVYHQVDEWGAVASVELHFNAAGDPTASGTETLTSGSSRSVKLATYVQMELVEILGLRDRGIKVRNSRTRGRGYRSLVSGAAPAIITEPFFATSSKGRQASDSEYERQVIAEAILEGCNRALDKF